MLARISGERQMLIKGIVLEFVTSAALFSKRTKEKRAKTQKTLFSRHGIVSRRIRFDPRDNVTFYFSFGATTEKINRRRKMCQLLKVRIEGFVGQRTPKIELKDEFCLQVDGQLRLVLQVDVRWSTEVECPR